MPDMPHIFGYKASDWVRGICSSCKSFTLDGASIVQMLKVVGVSIVQ